MNIKLRKAAKARKKKRKKLLIRVLIISGIFFIIKGIFFNKDNVTIDSENYTLTNKGDVNEIEKSLGENKYLILVNRSNKIDPNYEADDLVVPSIKFGNFNNTMVQNLRTDAAKAIQDMFVSAKKDKIKLMAISGYRSYEYQGSIYNNEVRLSGQEQADKYVAKPGDSEHQTGLAMDVLSTEYSTLDEGFENTDAFRWLSENMSEYGFILRYVKGKEYITGYEYEPWHLRYVGREVAIEIMERGITLEEYLNKVSK